MPNENFKTTLKSNMSDLCGSKVQKKFGLQNIQALKGCIIGFMLSLFAPLSHKLKENKLPSPCFCSKDLSQPPKIYNWQQLTWNMFGRKSLQFSIIALHTDQIIQQQLLIFQSWAPDHVTSGETDIYLAKMAISHISSLCARHGLLCLNFWRATQPTSIPWFSMIQSDIQNRFISKSWNLTNHYKLWTARMFE